MKTPGTFGVSGFLDRVAMLCLAEMRSRFGYLVILTLVFRGRLGDIPIGGTDAYLRIV